MEATKISAFNQIWLLQQWFWIFSLALFGTGFKFSLFSLPCKGYGGKELFIQKCRKFLSTGLKAFKKVISYHGRPNKVKGTVNTRSPTAPLLLFHPGATRLKSFWFMAFHNTATWRISLCCQEIPFCHREGRVAYPEFLLPAEVVSCSWCSVPAGVNGFQPFFRPSSSSVTTEKP